MKYFALTLAASLALLSNTVVAANANADTTTTTTIQTTGPAVPLPTGETYVVVDPASGVSGVYDMTTRLINGRPVPLGSYVIEQSTGKVLATVDASGNFVAINTIPTMLPEHFTVIDGRLMYFASDYDLRRARLNSEIAANYDAGKLSNTQVRDLRERLAEVGSLEAKRKDDGSYSSSTAKSIERKLVLVQSDLAKDISEINSKRAKMGLKVE